MNSGPFADGSPEWAVARTVWDPIHTRGGGIFGYVHTCATPTGPHRFEIATGSDNPAPDEIEPNGPLYAPHDKRYKNPDGSFNPNPPIN